VAVLQCIPAISITSGIPVTFLPLGVVLGFDGVVSAREDYRRHADDARANASESQLSGARIRCLQSPRCWPRLVALLAEWTPSLLVLTP